MPAELFKSPAIPALDSNANPLPNATWNFYLSGTLTPAPVYSSASLSTSLGPSVPADAGGRFPKIFFDPAVTYRGILKDQNGVSIPGYDFDPINDDIASQLMGADGSEGIGFKASGADAVLRTVRAKLRDRVSVFDYIPVAQQAGITANTSAFDVTTYAQKALTNHLDVNFPPGTFTLSDALTLRSGQSVTLSPGTTIVQTGTGKNAFYGTGLSNVTIILNGGALRGNGGWLGTWASNGAAAGYRGIRFYNCNFVNVIGPGRIYNWGHAGISFEGGKVIRVDNIVIEGTHEYGTALPAQANFQMGVYLKHATATGPVDRAILSDLDISGTAQGFLVEFESGAQPAEGIQIINPVIHDIPGQHAFYLQCGQIIVTNPMLRDICLAGVKLQATSDQNVPLTNLVVTGMNAKGLGSHMFEIAHISGTGSIQNCQLEGVGENVNTGIGITATSTGSVRNLKVVLNLKNVTTSAVTMSGAGLQQDIDMTIVAEDIQMHGIVSTATNQNNVVITPIIRNANLSASAGQYAIVAGASGSKLILIDPVVSGTTHKYAIAASAAGAEIRIRGTHSLAAGVTGTILRTGLVEGTYPAPYTPTLSSDTGAPVGTIDTTGTFYTVENDFVEAWGKFTLTDVTAASGQLYATGPYAASIIAHGTGWEDAITGKALTPVFRASALSKINLPFADGNTALGVNRVYSYRIKYKRA